MSSGIDSFRHETVVSDIDEEYEPSVSSGSQRVDTDSGSDSYDADNPDGDAPQPEPDSDSESELEQPPTPVEDEFAVAPASAIQSVPKSTIDPVTLQKIIKSKEEADNARNRMIIIVAIVTTLIVIGVTLGIIFGYNRNSASETPVWAQDGASRYEYNHVAIDAFLSPTNCRHVIYSSFPFSTEAVKRLKVALGTP